MEIKSSWDELTVSEFEQIEKVLKDKTIPESCKTTRVLSILSKYTEDELETMPIVKYMGLVKKIDFIQTEPKYKTHKKKYIINGKRYDLKGDIGSITTAQYIDYQTFSKESQVDLKKILGVWLIPHGREYNEEYDLEEVFKDMGELPLTEAMGISFFFAKQLATYILILKDSLEKNLTELQMNKNQTETLITHLEHMAYSLWYLPFQKKH